MSLTITPDLIRALAHAGGRTDCTGIVLDADGYRVASWVEHSWHEGIVVRTRKELDALAEQGDVTVDDEELVAWLCTSADGDAYAVPDEKGTLSAPEGGQRPQVVTGRFDGAGGVPIDDYSQTDVWWFDAQTATELISERPGSFDSGNAISLWLTAGGRYVICRRSPFVSEPAVQWLDITAQDAARHALTVEPQQVTAAPRPPLLVAAEALRTLVATIEAPQIPRRTVDGTVISLPQKVLAEATAVCTDARIVNDLLRDEVLPLVRYARSAAAKIVVDALGTQQAAADHLGISQSVLSRLLPKSTDLAHDHDADAENV